MDIRSLSDEELQRQLSEKLGRQPEPVIQEMHPDISEMDRLNLKNFGGSSAESIDYLKKKTGLDVKEIGGQIVAKRPDEKQWRTLDPEGLGSYIAHPTEVLKDIGDVGYDALSAGLNAAGTAAAGVAGAAGGGIGAIPAAMAASGGISGGMEGLRQAIGNMTGAKKGADYTDIALATGLGAASPVLFGSSAGAKDITKQLLKTGFAGGAEKKAAIQAAQSGLPVQFAKKVLGSSLTGVPQEAIEAAPKIVSPVVKEMLPDLPAKATVLDAVNSLQKTGSGDLIDKLKNRVTKDGYDISQKLQNEVGEGLAKVHDNIPVGQYADRLTAIADEHGSLGNPESESIKDSIYKMRDSLFGGKEELTPQEFMKLKNQVSKRAGYEGTNVVSPASSYNESAARDIEGLMSDDIWKAVEKASPRVGEDGKGLTLRDKYRDFQTLQRDILPEFKTGKKAEATLKKYTLGTNAEGDLTNPGWLAGRLQEFQSRYGTPIGEVSQILNAQKYFGKPSWHSISGQGAPATAKILTGAGLGALVGSTTGHQVTGDNLGAYAGGGMGALMGAATFSPAMLKKFIQANINTAPKRQAVSEILRKYVPGATGGAALPSAWQYLNNRGER